MSRGESVHKILLSFVLAGLGTLAVSAAFATPLPEEFLSEILAKDFTGDGAFRVGKVLHRAGAPRDADGVPREAFVPALSPIVIVSDWHFSGTRLLTHNDAVAKATFTVIALTGGEGDTSSRHPRRIAPLSAPHSETVEYRLHQRNGAWLLVDPPLPRVNIANVVEDIQREIHQFPPETHRSPAVQASYRWESEQLRTLMPLIPK